MYGHNCLNSVIKIVFHKHIMQIYRHKTSLPVVTMYDIWSKIKAWKCRQRCFTEECKLFNILMYITIRFISCKVKLIIYEIEFNAFIFHLQNPYILLAPCKVNIKMCVILHLLFPFIWNTCILWQHDPYVKLLFIKILW